MEAGKMVFSFGFDQSFIYIEGVIDMVVQSWIVIPFLVYFLVKKLAVKAAERKAAQAPMLGVVQPSGAKKLFDDDEWS